MFNNGLANLKASGEFQKILDKYLATDSTSESSTVDETTIWGLLKNNSNNSLRWTWRLPPFSSFDFLCNCDCYRDYLYGMFSVSHINHFVLFRRSLSMWIRGIPLMILAAFIFWGVLTLSNLLQANRVQSTTLLLGTMTLSLNSAAPHR